MPTYKTHHEGRLSPDQEKSYVHLPFDMPDDATRLEVEYHYSEQIDSDPTLTGGNTIDLGVFDERGIRFLQAGFRGWTGSERLSFWIAKDGATPGYLAGGLNPGQWHVLLGLYKIAPGGCDYQVNIAVTTSPGDQTRPAQSQGAGDLPSSLPPAPFAPWLCGELHCHTYHSDGELSPAGLVALARDRGLDFLAVTDHNSIACQRDLQNLTDPGLVLIRGVEVTTFKGHFNVWGIPDWVDFRVQSPEDLRGALDYANSRGALTSCGHPKPFGPGWDYPEVTNYQVVEAWNGPWNGLNELSLEFWTGQLAAGRRIPVVGGSDYHRVGEEAGGRPRLLGTPANWVYVPVDPSPASILAAVRQGHVSLSDEPGGPFLDLRGGADGQSLAGDACPTDATGKVLVRVRCLRGTGCRLRLLDQQGVRFEQTVPGEDSTLEWPVSPDQSRFIRAELRDNDERLRALTNPVYLGA